MSIRDGRSRDRKWGTGEAEHRETPALPSSENGLSNQSLVDGLARGDTRAATQFHKRYRFRIDYWVWRLLGTDCECEDMVQQVFVNILSGVSRINCVDSLDSWVDSVTIRTVRYELRRRQRRRSFFLRSDEFDIEDCGDTRSPFQLFHVRRFYAILNTMPTDARMIFVARHLNGYGFKHIASTWNTSMSTVKRKLKRADILFRKKVMRDGTLISLRCAN